MSVSARRDYWLHVKQAQACIEATDRVLILGLKCHAAGLPKQALAWYGRADSSLNFAAALIAWASSGSALAPLRRP